MLNKNKTVRLSSDISSSEFKTDLQQLLVALGYQLKIIDERLEVSGALVPKPQGSRIHSIEGLSRVLLLNHNDHSIYVDFHRRCLMPLSSGIFALKNITKYSRLEMVRLIKNISALILTLDGYITLHGNVLSMKKGEAFAILGESGKGKSTLTLALIKEGAHLICDDLCVFDLRTGKIKFQHDSLNISPSTYQFFFQNNENAEPTHKITIRAPNDDDSKGVYYLQHIYQLGPKYVDKVTSSRMPTAQAVYELMRCAIFDPREIGESLHQYTHNRAKVQIRTPLQQLYLPKGLNQLAQVFTHLQSHI